MKYFNSLGVMLDCSRNAVMTVNELKKYISVLNKMGYNQFQLYTEDTYEVENEPFFGYRRGRYSIEELKELDDFCYSLGVELVPNIQTLAHLNAIVRWGEYNSITDCNDILLAGEECTYELIENMIKSLRKAFRSDKIHIGMDEAWMLGRGKYLDKHGLVDRSEILLSHLNRVCEITDKYGFKPMMWSDMFYRIATGGSYYASRTSFGDDIKKKIPDSLTLVYWDYYSFDKKHYDNMIKGHKALCDRIAFGGGAWKWSGFTPHNAFSIKCSKAAITSCIKGGIKDAFITCWGDDGAEASAWSILPSLCFTACIAQGITKLADIKAKFYECVGASYEDFMLLDLPDKLNQELLINPSKYLLYNDCFMGIFDKTVGDEDTKKYATYARKLKNAAKRTGEYAYLFHTASLLCSVLSIKADLGNRTRTAYLAKDTSALGVLIADYTKVIKRTEAFYEAYKAQWFKENKPHGFDIQDIRLGGFIARLKSCKQRLVDFKNGDIGNIPELEEETLEYYGKHINFNSWGKSASANVLSW